MRLPSDESAGGAASSWLLTLLGLGMNACMCQDLHQQAYSDSLGALIVRLNEAACFDTCMCERGTALRCPVRPVRAATAHRGLLGGSGARSAPAGEVARPAGAHAVRLPGRALAQLLPEVAQRRQRHRASLQQLPVLNLIHLRTPRAERHSAYCENAGVRSVFAVTHSWQMFWTAHTDLHMAVCCLEMCMYYGMMKGVVCLRSLFKCAGNIWQAQGLG